MYCIPTGIFLKKSKCTKYIAELIDAHDMQEITDI